MSWPSIWQTPSQAQGTGSASGAQAPAMNMGGMYQLTAEQQYALQQQNWQQWQVYQTQLAQWQAQYGERYHQEMMAQNMVSNMASNAYLQQSVVPPPPPVDHQPPPPPPPQQQTHENTQSIAQIAINVQQQTPTNPTDKISNEQPSTSSNKNQEQIERSDSVFGSYDREHQRVGIYHEVITSSNHTNISSINSNQTQLSNMPQTHGKNTNFDSSNYSQQNQDGYRRNQQYRNNRWNNNNNNNNNRNNRMFGGNNFSNRNQYDDEDEAYNDSPQQQQQQKQQQHENEHANEEKSQEEIAFDIQFRKWEEGYSQWKIQNANHPDQNQYNDFVIKMEGCREQLLQRREKLRQKRLDSIRETQIKQKNVQGPPDIESQRETIEKTASDQANPSSTETATSFAVQSSSGSSLFATNNEGGIPGLDLVETAVAPKTENVPKSDLNIVAHVNNILGNPEIQSLLSNIQKQQTETEQSKPPTTGNPIESDFPSGSNTFSQPKGNVSRFERYPNKMDTQQPRNPFRHESRDDRDISPHQTSISNQFENNTKRGRFRNENSSKPSSYGDHFDRDRGNFAQQSSPNQDIGLDRFNQNRKRPREPDNFNNDFNQSPNDCEEYRPVQVIDYSNQNRQNQPRSFGEQTSAHGSSMSHQQPFLEHFPRKIIEYDHKTKIHPWNWFCPVIQMEYNHSKTGYSLHEHPPPRSMKKEHTEQPHWVKKEPKDEYRQLRQPKWAQQQGPIDRQERYSYGQHQHFQSRYENRQFISSSTQPTNEMYYRRNPADRNWVRNAREWNAPYEKFSEPKKNDIQKNDHPLPKASLSSSSSSSTQRQNHSAPKVQPNPKLNIKELLFPPGRRNRPKRIVILMRGVPGSGKSYVSKMIKDKEQEMGGSARILSIDDYFMAETDANRHLSYEYEAEMEATYIQYLLKSFKKTLMDNLYECVIVDCNNATLESLSDFYTTSKTHLFTPYICETPLDLEKCLKNNIHNRLENDIRKAIDDWETTPASYTVLDYDSLFNSADDTEEISDVEEDKDENAESLDAISDEENAAKEIEDDGDFSDVGADDEPINEFGVFKSKWDNDSTENKLARLDGTNKPMKHTTIEDYLQMDGWEPPPTSTNGKKRVRWADIEEKREQDKQRAIGFVVGQTNWNNLIDQPRDHSQALTKVKYIEKVRKN